MQKYPSLKTLDKISTNLYPPREERVTLIDALDKVLEKGAIVNGEVAIRVADVDLMYLGLRLVLTSVSKAEEMSGKNFSDNEREARPEEVMYLAKLEKQIREAEANIPRLVDVKNPKDVEKGLAKLVLTLIELIRRLMEREALRRIHRGSLADIEVQKLGMTFKALDKKMLELKTVFGLEDEELNLDLGPLGNLM